MMNLHPVSNLSTQENGQIYFSGPDYLYYNPAPSKPTEFAAYLCKEVQDCQVAQTNDSNSDAGRIIPTDLVDMSTQSCPKSEKPPYPYAKLIAQAILTSESQALTLNEIYMWITDKYPYYKTAASGWKNSIRHNLSLNKMFLRVPRAINEPGKGSYWTINFVANDVRTKHTGQTGQYSPYRPSGGYGTNMPQDTRWSSIYTRTPRTDSISNARTPFSESLLESHFIECQASSAAAPSDKMPQSLNHQAQRISNLPCMYTLEGRINSTSVGSGIYPSYSAEVFPVPYCSNNYPTSLEPTSASYSRATLDYQMAMPSYIEPSGKASDSFTASKTHNSILEMPNISTCYLTGFLEPTSQEFDQVSQGTNKFDL